MRTSNLFRNMPGRVRIVEVGPRDGLQNEAAVLPTEDKARFIELLAESGLSDIEVSSFVSPRKVPQLADAGEVFAGLAPKPGLSYSALVPNVRGLDRAIRAGAKRVAVFTAASETFTRENIGMTIAESLDEFRAVTDGARKHGISVRAYVSTAFVCPYEGEIQPEQVEPVVRELLRMGVDEVSLADTIGHATPDMVARLTEHMLALLPLDQFAYHFHDTWQMGLANVSTALQYGVAIFDSAAGGTGGCPFAPGAAGNLATEDLLVLLHNMGIETGVDLEQVGEAAQFLQSKLGRMLTSSYLGRKAWGC
jgi:hydroxymethylglutaryl-CoA lyase